MRKIIFLTFLLFFPVFSEELPESLASTEGFPSSLVRGCVCAITGEYVDSEVDLVVPGPKPLLLQRTYRSSDTTGHDLSRSWQLTGVDYILASTTQQQTHASWIKVILTTAHGVRANYTERLKNSATEEKFSLGPNLGYTNCGSGWMSGKTNLRNNKLYLRKKHNELSAQLINGEGCNRKYYPAISDDSTVLFRLKDEESRNNLKRVLFYNKNNEVNKIIQTDLNQTALYGGLTFVRHGKQRDKEDQCQMAIQSDTGELVTYGFRINKYKLKKSKEKQVDYYIEHAIRPKKQWVKYEYVDAHQKNHLLLSKKLNPRNRAIGIEYYQEGLQSVGDETIHASGSIIDRVKFIKAPLNQDSPELITSHASFTVLIKEEEIQKFTTPITT